MALSYAGTTLLALVLFSQRLTVLGWLGLLMVVGGVASGYLQEARGATAAPQPSGSS